MKIALLTLYFENYQPLADVVLPNWRSYCARHGYELIVHCGEYVRGCPIGFQKVGYAYERMFNTPNDLDAVAVLDLDLVITNPSVKIESFIDEVHDYFVTADVNGLNNGAFIVKKNEGGKQILQYILGNKHLCNNEQDMLKYHLDEPVLKDRLKIVPHPSFNSYWYDLYPEHGESAKISGIWEPGHFILHLPGLRLETRLELLSSDRAKAAIQL